MCLEMFSSMTIASSTTKPTHSVRAISERLSRLKLNEYISAKVPTMEMGRAMLGMRVARMLRRNTKITPTTRPSATSSVNSTSSTELRMVMERS